MLPVVTMIALSFGSLFSGALVVETTFAYLGVGKLIYDAILGSDFNLALLALMLATLVTLASNLAADLAYAWLDPRISYACLRRRSHGRRAACRSRDAGGRPCCSRSWRSAAVAAPLIESWLGLDTATVDLLARLESPSAAHPLGTDELGRDVLVRLLQAGRVSLAVGLCGALLAAAIGTVVGLAAGYAGGALDDLLMRLTDMVISLPLLPLLIVLAAIDLGKLGLSAHGEFASVVRIVVIVALFGWTTTARLVRASVLSLRTREFVRAAGALGAGR